jgi:hypothetical protein
MTTAGDAFVVALLVGGPALLAYAALSMLARHSALPVIAGLVLLGVAALFPLYFGYAGALGIAGGVLGGIAGAVRARRGTGWPHRALLALAILSLLAVPVAIFEASRIQSDEDFDRCAANKAVEIIDQHRAAGYPADMHEISMLDDSFGSGCYVGNGTNWLYRVSPPGTYTVGYWVDWPFARHVCLHTAKTQGWTCGFEQWQQFTPGERD